MSTDPISTAQPTRVTVVESEACHYCADARGVLDALGTKYPLAVEILDIRSIEGQGLVALHRAALSPLVLLDGVFFSHGRLPRRKLQKTLQRLYGDPADRCALEAG